MWEQQASITKSEPDPRRRAKSAHFERHLPTTSVQSEQWITLSKDCLISPYLLNLYRNAALIIKDGIDLIKRVEHIKKTSQLISYRVFLGTTLNYNICNFCSIKVVYLLFSSIPWHFLYRPFIHISLLLLFVVSCNVIASNILK